MTHEFDAGVVAAVLRHMNDDHRGDSLLIARAFCAEDPEGIADAVMTGFDGDGADWALTRADGTTALRIPWPGAIADRPSVRREVVALYDLACARLGVQPRSHA